MPPRNRYVSEYMENFKPLKAHLALERQEQFQKYQDQSAKQKPADKGAKRNVEGSKRKAEESKGKGNPALRYKAGLAPQMPAQNRIRYLSEYQKQFEWKRPLEREAPILSAEKMIYGGQDGNPSRATKLTLPKKSEYQLQFVKHPMIKSPERKEELDKDKEGHRHVYSPVGYQDAGVAAGKPSNKSPPPNIPAKSMVFQSEYHANFKSPSKFDYVKGSWLGADPPQLHPPDEKSDSDNNPSSHAWYQQVLELRDKVCNYKSRAREGSHFLSLLEDLKKYEQQQNRKEGKPTNNDNQPEPPRKSTPVKTKPDEPASNQNPDDKKGKSGGEGEDMGAGIKPAAKIATVNDAGEEHLFWDKAHTLPGPALQKIHSLETMSNESTITSRSSRNSPEQPAPVGRREAWTDNKRPADRTHVIPPYHTAEPSDVDDTLSDVTITELSNVDEQDLSYNEKPIHHATRKLFTGKRQDIDNDRRDIGGDHKGIGITRKLIGDERNFFGDDREDIDDSQVVGNSHKYIGGSRQVVGENRGYIDEVRREISGKKVSSFSSDDERSSSVISQTSSILSVEAMDKRRALASQTLQRAKRRQAQL